MMKTTFKAKPPLGLDKDGPGEIPIFCRKIGSAAQGQQLRGGIGHGWSAKLLEGAIPGSRLPHTFFKSIAKDEDRGIRSRGLPCTLVFR